MIDDTNHELLSAYLDGELTADERQRAEKLLAENAACRQVYEELQALRGSLAALPRHKLDENISARVLRMAEQSMLGKARMPGDATARREGDELVGAATGDAERMSADRRSRAWRAIIYPVLAVAAAVAMIVNSPNDKGKREPQVARAPVKQAPPAALSAPPDEAGAAAPLALEEADSQHGDDSANKFVPVPMIAGKKIVGSADTLGLHEKVPPSGGPVSLAKTRGSIVPSAPPTVVGSQSHHKLGAASPQATLVITCKLAPEAVRDKAFDALLTRNHLAPWSAPELATIKSAKRDDKSPALAGAPAAAEPAKKETERLAQKFESLDRKDASWAKNVVVELDARDLVAVLADLQNHPEQFLSVELPRQPADVTEPAADATAAESAPAQTADAPKAGVAGRSSGRSSPKRLVVLFRLSAAAED